MKIALNPPAPDTILHMHLPVLAFHGTSARSWKKKNPAGGLFLTINRKESASYAYEQAARDEEDGHAPKPIIVIVPVADLADAHGLTLSEDNPRNENLTWQETVRLHGGFVLDGFAEKMKTKCKIEPLG